MLDIKFLVSDSISVHFHKSEKLLCIHRRNMLLKVHKKIFDKHESEISNILNEYNLIIEEFNGDKFFDKI